MYPIDPADALRVARFEHANQFGTSLYFFAPRFVNITCANTHCGISLCGTPLKWRYVAGQVVTSTRCPACDQTYRLFMPEPVIDWDSDSDTNEAIRLFIDPPPAHHFASKLELQALSEEYVRLIKQANHIEHMAMPELAAVGYQMGLTRLIRDYVRFAHGQRPQETSLSELFTTWISDQRLCEFFAKLDWLDRIESGEQIITSEMLDSLKDVVMHCANHLLLEIESQGQLPKLRRLAQNDPADFIYLARRPVT